MKFIWLIAIVLLAAAAAYFFIPYVRYRLIPLTGGTRAPEKLTSSMIMLRPGQQVPERHILADATTQVASIDLVPAQDGWINSLPLDLQELYNQKKIVLIDFWTYTCINCIRATPYTQELWDRYKDHGLVVIGVHSPEFDIEHDPKNIFSAIEKAGITYPVVTDGDMKIWHKFGNHSWPGKYLINNGVVVYTQFGEGDYQHEEDVVRKQLEKNGWQLPEKKPVGKFLEPIAKQETPELYAGPGFIRQPYGNLQQPEVGKVTKFVMPEILENDSICLDGTWKGETDYVESQTSGMIALSYLANSVYIVLDAQKPDYVAVLLDGKPVPSSMRGKDISEQDGHTVMYINEPRLYYPIAGRAPYGRYQLQIKVPAGIKFYSFTFGVY